MDVGILFDIGFFIAVLLVNFFGAISGGGGLVVRPLLIFLGVPPQFAIGTTRTANVVTRLVGLSRFHKHSKIDWKLAFTLMIPATIGSIIGVQIVVSLQEELLTKVIGAFILLSGIGLLIKKEVGTSEIDFKPSKRRKIVGSVVYGASTLVATLTGGGGVINNFILLNIYKKSYITAAAIRKVAGFGGALVGALLFIHYGFVDWYYALLILVAGSLGTFWGIKHGLQKGEKWARTIVLVVVFVFGVKMLFF
jgi:hypothetical protein